MKKVMILAVAVAMAVASHAASFTWKTANNVTGIDTATLNGNDTYNVSTATSAKLKGASALTYTLTIYENGTANVVDTFTGNMKFGSTNQKASVGTADSTLVLASTTYDYVLKVTGKQNNITGTIGDWDYTDATITATMSGSITTGASGDTTLTVDPTSWVLEGATQIPEPTSGLLMLIGLAGLALKRKNA